MMSKLNESHHHYLNDQILKCLSQHKINTVLDLLQADCQKLMNITHLSLSDIILIRDSLLQNLCPKAKTDDDLYSRMNSRSFILNIKRLDILLEPGIPFGECMEVCGLPGAGKTQFCFTVAINMIQSTHGSVLYIDTKGDFSANRIQQVLEMRGLSTQEMQKIMIDIHVVRIWNISDLILFLHQIKNGEILIKNLRVIMIDSLPALMYQFHGDQNKLGLIMLNNFVNIIRFICKQHNLMTIVVNLVTRWVELNAMVTEDTENIDNVERENQMNIYQETKTRSLGKYWQYIPIVVINLEVDHSVPDKQNEITLKASILKSPDQEKVGRSCMISLSSKGIT